MTKARIALVALLAGFALLLGVLVGLVAPRFLPARPAGPVYTTASVVRQIQTLSQLVTVKYVIEKVVILEDVKWFGENRVLLLSHGVVKAGIDLAELKPSDLEIHEKTIHIRLPPARVTDAYLDDKRTEVIERSTGVLRSFDKDLEQNARRQAVDDIRRAARAEGILNDATERAQLQLGNLLRQLGFEEVNFSE
jgi:hypothetical protein